MRGGTNINSKVLIVSNISTNLYKFRLPLINELLKQGNLEVKCVSQGDKFYDRLSAVVPTIDIKLKRRSISPFSDFLYFLNLLRLYRREKPSVILHFTIKPVIYGSMAASILKIPSIASITGLGSVFTNRGKLLRKIVEFLYKLSLKYVNYVIFQNNEDMKYFVEKGIIPKEKAIVVMGSGVDIEYFSPLFCKNVEHKDTKIFLMVSRIIPSKGVRIFVEAARRIKKQDPSVRFALLGPLENERHDSIKIEEIKTWEKEGIIEYWGVVDDVRECVCKSTFVVLPTYYREGIPRSLLEALALGKPIITTNIPGCREVVEEGVNGFLIKPKDVDSLVQALKKAINLGKDKIIDMGRKSRELAEKKFDSKIIVGVYIEKILEILRNRGG